MPSHPTIELIVKILNVETLLIAVDDGGDDLLRAIEPASARVVALAALVDRRMMTSTSSVVAFSTPFLRSVFASEVVPTVDVANTAVRKGAAGAADLPCWWHSLGFAVSASARRAHNLKHANYSVSPLQHTRALFGGSTTVLSQNASVIVITCDR